MGNLQMAPPLSEQQEVRDKVLSALIVADPKPPEAGVAGAAAQEGGSGEEYGGGEPSPRGGGTDAVDDLILDAGRRRATGRWSGSGADHELKRDSAGQQSLACLCSLGFACVFAVDAWSAAGALHERGSALLTKTITVHF